MNLKFQYGVDSEYTRNQILDAIQEWLIAEGESDKASAPAMDLDDEAPSAPSDDEPSAPAAAPAVIETFKTGECVVCMENKVCTYNFMNSYTKSK